MNYSGTVENVGTIVDDVSFEEAKRRVLECINHSARAGNYGFVQGTDGELVWETGEPSEL